MTAAGPGCFAFVGDALCIGAGGDDTVPPRFPAAADFATDAVEARERVDDDDASPFEVLQLAGVPEGMQAIGVRALHDRVDADTYRRAGRAAQLAHWRRTHRFCGCCGAAAERDPVERCMRCPACGHCAYPRINPVVITRVTDGDRILLVKRTGAATPFHSVIAGFVEAGETLEEAVVREVAEESGVRIRDLRYFRSQPWPFPNNLMIAFTAVYDGGTPRPDGFEIAEAAWYTADRLPAIPGRMSVSRALIDDFVAGREGQ